MAARALLIAVLAAIGCGDSETKADQRGKEIRRERAIEIHQEAWRSAPCPGQKCRELPRGLHGVELDMSVETVGKTLELSPVERPALACSNGVASFDAATEIGGEAATCSLDFAGDRLVSIDCALDGARHVEEHKAIGWALYQTLARQYGRATDLDDELMSAGRLSARWTAPDRSLSLRLELLGDRSVIRLANRASARDALGCPEISETEVYEPERMAEKARSFLRDLTGPLESEAP